MARAPVGAAMRQLERIFGGEGTVSGLTEAQLLDRFAATNDDAAFEAIVRRHGRAVLAVCKRLLHDPHEAEDAFQATFLVLARRAGSISRSRPIGPWLVGVAYRIASKARVASARRRRRESVAAGRNLEAVDAPAPITIDLGPVLWEELNRLPGKYREPVVLCWVEGHSHDEAADLLRWPVGTVKGRLHRAKETLRTRLSRRGITAPAAGLSAWFSSEAAAAIVPPPVLGSTLKSAVLIASGASLLAGTVPAGVALLARGALQTMFLTKLSISAASVALVGTTLVGGLGVLAGSNTDGTSAPDPGREPIGVLATGPEQPDPPSRPVAKDDLTASREDTSDQASVRGDQFAGSTRKKSDRKAEPPGEGASDEMPVPPFLTIMEDPFIAMSSTDAGLQLHRARAALARLRVQLEFFKAGTINVDRILDATRSLLDAKLDLLQTPALRHNVLEEYRDFLASLDATEGEKLEIGTGSRPDKAEVALALAEAELMLASSSLEPTDSPSSRTGNAPAFILGTDEGGLGFSSDSGKGAAREGKRTVRDNDPASKAIRSKLDLAISMPFDHDTPLSDVLEYVRQATADDDQINGIPIYVDEVGLQEVEQTLQSPVQMNIDGIPLKTTLWLTLRQLDLAYSIIDGVLIISNREQLEAMLDEDPIFQGLSLEEVFPG